MKGTECLAILLAMLVILANIPMSLGAPLTPQSGILVAKGFELPDLIGVPESNVRFSLWNVTTWMELPYWINQEKVIQTARFEANGTSVKGELSDTCDKISKNDLISVKVPAEIGVDASDGNWWDEALHLGLQNRFLVQFSDDMRYTNRVYVYYQMKGRSLSPIYPLSQYANAVSTNGTQTTSRTSSSLTQTIFRIKSLSKPQAAVLYATTTDPQVYSLNEIMLKRFEGTGWNPQPTDLFYMPSQGQAVTGVILRIEGKSYGDEYSPGNPISRYLQVRINGQNIWGGYGQIVTESFTFSPDITNKAVWWNEATKPFNTADVTLTTWVGYWVVRAYIYVVYNAESHFSTSYSLFANWYKFQNTGWNIISFSAQLPESIVNEAYGAKAIIYYNNNGDTRARYLELYIDGQKVKRWTVPYDPSPLTWDITSYLLGKSKTTVGIVITTWVGYWTIEGTIAIKSRSEVAPDSSSFWREAQRFVTQRAGNIFDDYSAQNNLAGLFSFITSTKEQQTVAPFDTAVTVSIPQDDRNWLVIAEIDVHIRVKYGSTSTYIPSESFRNLHPYGGSDSGSPSQTGSDLLALLAAGLSYLSPELALLATVASVLVKYADTGGIDFHREPDGSGIHLNWWTALYDVKQKSILGQYDVNWPNPGQYDAEVQTVVKIYGYNAQGIRWWTATASFLNTFGYYNG